MRLALIGDHPDGLAAARALVATGRHALVVYSGPATGAAVLARAGLTPRRIGDLEEALADREVDAVIVASAAGQRAPQVRRALQSEHHVLCVHPVDPSADAAYEAASVQGDVGCILVPLLPESFHPGVRRLLTSGRLPRKLRRNADGTPAELPLEAPRLVEFERWSVEEILLDDEGDAAKPGLPGWDVLRLLAGEIEELTALGRGEELGRGEPLLITGRFQSGVLLQCRWLPKQSKDFWRVALIGRAGRMELVFDAGWPGPATLRYAAEDGSERTETWPAWHPWETLATTFDETLERWQTTRIRRQPGMTDTACLTQSTPAFGWLDEIRALELDDATRRSLLRHRAMSLDFPEATEEASFKGTMTLVGCSLLWLTLVLLIFSVWFPALGWAILPIFGVFLALQFLGWVVPENQKPAKP